MTWDALLVAALARELEIRLRGARLRAHSFRWEEREVVLWFRSGALRWSLHPRNGWLTFTPDMEVPGDARPLSASVVGVTAPPDERRLEIHLRKDRGKVRVYALAVELMTNQWNAFLLEGEEKRIRHLLWTRHLEERTLSVGQSYVPPQPSHRLGLSRPPTATEWANLLSDRGGEEARQRLLETVAFTSPINAPYLLEPLGARAGAHPRGKAGASTPSGSSSGPDPISEINRRWTLLRDARLPGPCVLETGGDKQPYPFILQSYNYYDMPNILTAIQAVSGEGHGPLDPEEEVREGLARALQRAEGRVRGLRRELAQAADPEEPRAQANLLLARLAEIPRGAGTVTLRGFHGEEVRIDLDPAARPQENAARLYEEAARRERARERLPALLEKAQGAVTRLEAVAEGLTRGSITVEEARRRIPRTRKPSPSRGREEERLPFRRYRSSGGLEIRVGRSSRDNDALTFRHSHPEDVWLHARDRAGAHVILRWRAEGNPPQRDLAEAAVLAALHSGARSSGSVPVDWTRRKYVRKPRKAPPGTVVPERVQTLFVEPDPALPERLRKGEEQAEEHPDGKPTVRSPRPSPAGDP